MSSGGTESFENIFGSLNEVILTLSNFQVAFHANTADQFVSTLSGVGIEFDTLQKRWTLSKSAAQSKRLLTTAWRSLSEDQRDRCEEVLGKQLDQSSTLKALLLPLLPVADPAQSTVFHVGAAVQESVIRFLIEIPKLQTKLLVLLLERLPEYEYRDGEAMEDNIPKLILSQLRWLPWIENSISLADAFLNALSLSNSPSLKRDIITWIPETADDSAVDTLVPALLSLMETEPDLLSACLDTLSNLRLSEEHIATVQSSATSLLDSVDPENVPVLIKFLFHVVKTESLPKLFKDLRKKLKIESLPNKSSTASSKGSETKNASMPASTTLGNNCPTMLVECLKASIRARHDLVTAFLSDFTSVSPKDDRLSVQHSLLDVWMIFLIHANLKNLQPKVELLLRKKLVSGQLKSQLLSKSISIHSVALRDLYPTISELAQVLMQHAHQDSKGALTQAAMTLYIALFVHSNDAQTRQSILGQLMRHVSSLSNKEADGALLAFDTLVTKFGNLIQPFSTYLQGLVDFMDGSKLDNSQLVRVYFIFAKIAYPKGPLSFSADHESKAAEFLTMLILKQTSNPETRYRQMGMLGCVAIVCVLGAPLSSYVETVDPEAISDEVKLTIEASTLRCCEILSSAFASSSPEALELFLDEMSCSLTQRASERPLRPEILEHICQLTSSAISVLCTQRTNFIEFGKKKGFLPPASSLDSDLTQSRDDTQHSEQLPLNIWCDVISLWPKETETWKSGEVFESALGLDLYFEDDSSTQSFSQISTASALLRLLFTSFDANKSFSDIQLVQFACLNLCPRTTASTMSLYHAFLNSQRPKALEAMAIQMIHAINITREFVNIATLLSAEDVVEGLDMDAYISVRVSQLVQLEAHLDAVLDHLPDFPHHMHGSSANMPLVHAADILRESASGSGRSGGAKAKKSGSGSTRGRKPKYIAGASATALNEGEVDGESNMDVSDDGEEDREDGEDGAEMGPEAPSRTGKAGNNGPIGSSATPSVKSWGQTGPFDLRKFRKNLVRILPRLRPLQPQAMNALYKMEEAYTDNQMRWTLLGDLTEKMGALVNKKISLNPAKQKSEPAWLRAYGHQIDCLFQMIPALTALPRQLLLLTSPEEAETTERPSMTQGLANFGSRPICTHLQAPCVRLTLGLLKAVVANPLCYTPYDLHTADEPKKSFVAQDVAQKLLQTFVPENENSQDELACKTWTEFALACFARLSKYEYVLTDFETAVALVDLLNALAASITEDELASQQLQKQVSEIAARFLNKYWTHESVEATDANSIFRENAKNVPLEGLETMILALLGGNVLASEVTQSVVRDMADLVDEMNGNQKEEEKERLKTLTSSTLATYFKVILTRVIQALSNYSVNDSVEEEGEEQSVLSKLDHLSIGLKISAFLLKKTVPAEIDRTMLSVALKQGKLMVEAFQSKCEWIFQQVEVYPLEVQHLMKSYQHATRTLQQNCLLVKERQYRQLGSLLAPLKKSMETVVAKVRLLSDKHDFGDLVDVKIWNQSAGVGATAESGVNVGRGNDARENVASKKAVSQARSERNVKKRKRDEVDEEASEEVEAETE